MSYFSSIPYYSYWIDYIQLSSDILTALLPATSREGRHINIQRSALFEEFQVEDGHAVFHFNPAGRRLELMLNRLPLRFQSENSENTIPSRIVEDDSHEGFEKSLREWNTFLQKMINNTTSQLTHSCLEVAASYPQFWIDFIEGFTHRLTTLDGRKGFGFESMEIDRGSITRRHAFFKGSVIFYYQRPMHLLTCHRENSQGERIQWPLPGIPDTALGTTKEGLILKMDEWNDYIKRVVDYLQAQ